ncbi:MAG: transposase [Deltaproteobacteria bacterium]|nr:transposase [Deltaproteobacteria bacterium]MBN2671343.1 transposase [Deltaproteobacteria bacterium]
MFKPTDRQRTIFEVENKLPRNVQERLRSSWSEGFQARVLPILLDAEHMFSALYNNAKGRPNWSIARMLGICVLQEIFDLDDQKALDCLAFDIRWQHSLGITPEESYLSRRSLVDFRSRLVSYDPKMKMVRAV